MFLVFFIISFLPCISTTIMMLIREFAANEYQLVVVLIIIKMLIINAVADYKCIIDFKCRNFCMQFLVILIMMFMTRI